MTCSPIFLIDEDAAKIAALDVQLRNDLYVGTISLAAMPPHLRKLFDEFEEIVNDLAFSCLDDIVEQIQAAELQVLFEDGCKAQVVDLQVFPSTNAVSFKTRSPVVV